ncbi:MAG TPA: ATP-binding protein [Stellaceae bacterium]|nr:ATP-binding protein [Stellaceae bacterium]
MMRHLDPDPRWEAPATLRYGLSVLVVAAATIVQQAGRVPFDAAPTPAFMCVVVVSAWFGGIGPGLLATALSVLALGYHVVGPIGAFAVEAAYIPALALFSLAALIVTWLSARERQTAKSLSSIRDQLDDKLRELEKSKASLQAEIAARKQAEDELHRLRIELAHINRVMTLGELAASIAHEINQPLAAVVADAGAALRWLDGKPPDLSEARQALARINKNGNRAADVIGRIRALAKKSSIQMDPVDMNEVILTIIAVTRREIDHNHVALRTELDANLPAVRGDRVQLQQVVLNLIMNAIEAVTAGEPRHLLICSSERAPHSVVVSVCDSGPGLDPQNVNRLFEAFYSTKVAGMGMGLAICRSIMEAHGGRLSARANEPCGAIFEFELPTVRASEA